jgi:hypothetical protein
VLEVHGAGPHAELELLLLGGELDLQPPRLEQVAHAQPDLVEVEGLRDEVGGALAQGPALGLRRDVGGEDEHRHADRPGVLGPDDPEDREAVEPGHHEVEEQDVRPRGAEQVGDLRGVARRRDVGVAPALEQLGEQAHVRRLVVDNEHARLFGGGGGGRHGLDLCVAPVRGRGRCSFNCHVHTPPRARL